MLTGVHDLEWHNFDMDLGGMDFKKALSSQW